MLIEFSVTNFRSFKEKQTLSLVAGRDEKHAENLIDCGGFNLVKGAAIYGANASGKSNLLRAMAVMSTFVQISATRLNLDDPIPGIVPFRLDAQSAEQPTCFEITLLLGETRYEYSFSATEKKVFAETLTVREPKKKASKWIDRTLNSETDKTTLACSGPLKKDSKMLKEKTRDNGLVLSRAAEFNIEAVNAVFLWFRKHLDILELSRETFREKRMRTVDLLSTNAKFRNTFLKVMRDADIGIAGFSVKIRPVQSVIISDTIKTEHDYAYFKSIGQPLTKSEIQCLHLVPGQEAPVSLDLDNDESDGTQQLFALAGPVLEALQNGSVVIVDELERSMHPLLARKLIELFQSPEVNKSGAQIIFTTHDTTLMDPALFRRDQIWITEKNRDMATEMFSLYDLEDSPRSTSAFQRNYLAGRFGGVPQFGPTFEDLELK